MPTTLAILLAMAGVLFLFAGLYGAFPWLNGKIVLQLQGPIRAITLVIGIALIAGAFYSNAQDRHSTEDLIARKQIADLKADLEQLQGRTVDLEGDTRSHLSISDRAIDESLLIALRAALRSTQGDWQTCILDLRGAESSHWFQSPVQHCDYIQNATLPIEVVVPIPAEARRAALAASLHALHVPFTLTSGKTVHPGLGVRLGIVFADNVPRELVCHVRDAFLQATQKDISAAIPASEFRKHTAGASASVYGIQVGFAVQSLFEKRPEPLTVDNWQEICGSDYNQMTFDSFLIERANGFTPRLASSEATLPKESGR